MGLFDCGSLKRGSLGGRLREARPVEAEGLDAPEEERHAQAEAEIPRVHVERRLITEGGVQRPTEGARRDASSGAGIARM